MPRSTENWNLFGDIKVRLHDAHGNYLAHDSNGLYYTNNIARALCFDSISDSIQDQINLLRERHGIRLTAEPVPPGEIFESCDRCKELFMPFMVLFDGKEFLCADCRRPRAHRGRPGK